MVLAWCSMLSYADTLRTHYVIILLFSEHVAPPKKPPRPGAPGHLASLCPVDSYNEGVKVFLNPPFPSYLTTVTNGSLSVLYFIVFILHALFEHSYSSIPFFLFAVWHLRVACCAICGWLWPNVLSLFSPLLPLSPPLSLKSMDSFFFFCCALHLFFFYLLICIHLSTNHAVKHFPLPLLYVHAKLLQPLLSNYTPSPIHTTVPFPRPPFSRGG